MFDNWSIQKKVGVAAFSVGVVGLFAWMARKDQSPKRELYSRYPNRFVNGMDLPGGRGQHRSPWDFKPDQFMRGLQVEMEHTDDWCVAGQIVLDHLDENPDYYGKGMPGCKRGEKLICRK